MFPKSEVFVIESAKFDEEDETLEGEILCDVLRLSGKEPLYYYIRTERELVEILRLFRKSGYRYLHLSLHGDSESLETTLDEIEFSVLGTILRPCLRGRRLLVSACEAVNADLALEVMPGSGCRSIVGPHKEITFEDAAILWAAFYSLMFRENPSQMRSKDIRNVLDGLVELFEIPIAYCDSENSTKERLEFEVFEVNED